MNYKPDGDSKNNDYNNNIAQNHPQEPAHQYTKITWTPQIHAQTTHMNRRTNTRRSPEPPKSMLAYQSFWNFKNCIMTTNFYVTFAPVEYFMTL